MITCGSCRENCWGSRRILLTKPQIWDAFPVSSFVFTRGGHKWTAGKRGLKVYSYCGAMSSRKCFIEVSGDVELTR